MAEIKQMKFFFYKVEDKNPYSKTYGKTIWKRDKNRDNHCNDVNQPWWDFTGNTKCEAMSYEPVWKSIAEFRCNNGISEEKQQDFNQYSKTYKQFRWIKNSYLDCNNQ